MARSNYSVTVSADTRWAIGWIKAMRWLAYLIGPGRALRLATWGAPRLIRMRIGDGRWQWYREP